jgi:RNA polymerase sigma-70 factor (ECF subfamily)
MDEIQRIRAAQQGNLDAFNELVLAYQGRAYNIAYRLLGEPASAADATQDAFISAYRNLSRYRDGSFVAWLMRIVTNACYDELRRQKRRPVEPLENLETNEIRFATDSDDPERAAQTADLNRIIQGCLDDLSEDMRTAAVLADVQGFDYTEVAAITGTTLGTVKSRISRARTKLRDCLGAYRELLPGG